MLFQDSIVSCVYIWNVGYREYCIVAHPIVSPFTCALIALLQCHIQKFTMSCHLAFSTEKVCV